MDAVKAGFGRIWRAAGHSRDGLVGAWRAEPAFRQEVMAAVVLVPAACLMPVPLLQRALLVAAVLLVMLVELLNSALEAAIDRIGPERHPLSKQAKDCGSAAVLVSVAIAASLWAAVLAGAFLGL